MQEWWQLAAAATARRRTPCPRAWSLVLQVSAYPPTPSDLLGKLKREPRVLTIRTHTVGSVSVVGVIAALILLFFRFSRRRRRSSVSSVPSSPRRPTEKMRGPRPGKRQAPPDPDMSESLAGSAAPMGRRAGDTGEPPPPPAWGHGDDQIKAPVFLARPFPAVQQTLKSLLGRGNQEPESRSEQDRMQGIDGFFVDKPLAPVGESRSLASPSSTSRPPPPQQPQEEFGLQTAEAERPRRQNSTDPRPNCSKDNRGSVASISSCTTCSSPYRSRFSFAFLLAPPIDLFKSSKGSDGAGDCRKSAWSDWFRGDESDNEKCEQAGPGKTAAPFRKM